MATLTFDEAEIFSIMAEEKVPKAQAKAVVRSLHKVKVDVSDDMNGLATKADIQLEVQRLDNKIDLVEERITRKMAQQQIATVIAIAAIMAIFRFWGV